MGYLFFLAGGGFRYGHEVKQLVEEPPIYRIRLEGLESSELVKQGQDPEGDALGCVLVVRQLGGHTFHGVADVSILFCVDGHCDGGVLKRATVRLLASSR